MAHPKQNDPSLDVPEGARLPVTVDIVALTVREQALHVLLITRLIEPFSGQLALPGGFVLKGEDVLTAANRELAEETGVKNVPGHMEQLRSYGPLGRDPRGDVLTVAHLLLAPDFPVLSAGSDAQFAAWYPVKNVLEDSKTKLAFDHGRILIDGLERARSKLEYSALGAAFCGEEFTIAELRSVYEAVWGAPVDARNFHRKAIATPGFLEETGRTTTGATGRPAALYRLHRSQHESSEGAVQAVLNPPIMRPAPKP